MAVAGQVIDEKYEVLTLIGKGGMSKVYLARDKRLNKQWAIKEIRKRARDKNNEVVVQSAIAEANMIKQLDHTAIVRIVDIIETDDVIYIIEDYIEGETLSAILKENGAQPQESVIEWSKEICEALEYLHTRKPPIIYRDMKPDNVMLKPDGHIKIIDFGIAREYKNQNISDTVSLGTKGYAAPEQFGGKGQTDARTDIYCLGVTMYHLLTGHNPCEPPYEIYPIRHWNPQLDAGLEAVVNKCTQLNPVDRYQSCAELLYALQHYRENGEIYRSKQKKKLKIFSVTAAMCLVFGIAGGISLSMMNRTNTDDFNQNILRAEKATAPEEKLEYYSRAAEIKPLSCQAYLGMVDTFKDDAAFSVTEEKLFKEKINNYLSDLRTQGDYGDLAFEVGKLYWYYYDYGKTETSDNQITRMKSAIQWFKDAAEYGGESSSYHNMAVVYQEIGEFNRDINLNIEEASDKGKYEPYWNNLEQLADMIADEENEIVELEACRLTVYAIESYARKFKSDGITRSQMENLLQKITERSEEVETTTEKTTAMKQEVLSRTNEAANAIKNAFRE